MPYRVPKQLRALNARKPLGEVGAKHESGHGHRDPRNERAGRALALRELIRSSAGKVKKGEIAGRDSGSFGRPKDFGPINVFCDDG